MQRYLLLLSLSFILFFSFVIITACQQRNAFEYASPAYTLSLPKDHASHHAYRTEWWYYTGHLTSKEGRQFGYQLTFFRTALSLEDAKASDDASRKHVYFAHFAVTDEDTRQFYFKEKQSRGAFGEANAEEDYYKVFIGNWSVQDVGKYMLLQAESDSLSLVLILEALKPAVLHGEKGYSQKGESPQNASMYYSYTRLKSTGALTLNGTRYTVEGESWKDHEFGTSQLDKNSIGWDWFSMQFSDSTELMVYTLRQADGSIGRFSSGTFVAADGSTQHLTKDDFNLEVLELYSSKKSGATYPAKWKLSIPKLDLQVTITPTVQDQELLTQESTRITYWEGSVRLTGTRGKNTLTGKGYVELTGYAKALNF
ncbi:MAG: carotenoid 1,2-hydratase [[Chlorobium] sp. 445]|nr:MAG: carotenoid 1,2-hydratase [[Chlorobium] sp. 445]